ncbi:thioredoxin family protein [Sungkyunkwania multivorans]
MKKILFIVALFSGIAMQAQKVQWMSFEEAVAAQEKEPKKIIMDVYTNWCGPCKMLDKKTLQNKDVAAYISEHYYAVKFNGEGKDAVTYKGNEFTNPDYDPERSNRRNSAHQFTSYLQVRGYPTLVFFDENADLIAPLTGYLQPNQLELYLKLFKDDKHKELKTREAFEEYQKSFVSEFKSE